MSMQVNPAPYSRLNASTVQFGAKKPVKQPDPEKFEKSGADPADQPARQSRLKAGLKAAKDYALDKKHLKHDALWGLAFSLMASILPGSQLFIFPISVGAPMLYRAFVGFLEGYKRAG